MQKVCTIQKKCVYLCNEKGKRVTAATRDSGHRSGGSGELKQLKKMKTQENNQTAGNIGEQYGESACKMLEQLDAIAYNLTHRRGQEYTRSAWNRGVNAYALELIEKLKESIKYADHNEPELPYISEAAMLNGAHNWQQYSDGGCALIYEGDIAARLCTASEIYRYKGGKGAPAGGWLTVQARALKQAAARILDEKRKTFGE